MSIETISAITLFVTDMEHACQFYRSIGLVLKYGGDTASFTSFYAGTSFLNLSTESSPQTQWGRVIFYVDDVDAFHQNVIAQGLQPEFAPRDAEWGERYFHLQDPDGHELSFARPLT